jgi:hypothetical protein
MYLIWTRTRDLPACSIVPQPTTLPRGDYKSYIISFGVNDLTRSDLLQNVQGNVKEFLRLIWNSDSINIFFWYFDCLFFFFCYFVIVPVVFILYVAALKKRWLDGYDLWVENEENTTQAYLFERESKQKNYGKFFLLSSQFCWGEWTKMGGLWCILYSTLFIMIYLMRFSVSVNIHTPEPPMVGWLWNIELEMKLKKTVVV